MAKRLEIGQGLRLPLDWITLATVVYGARGSGKTSFGRVAAEEAHKSGQRFCAVDLKGDWFGLKSSADGRHAGLPVVVFGGEHADVPLEPGAGGFVGETVAKLEQSCILDFELFSKGKQIRFLADFFEALYHHNREPLLLLLDEAQRYAPQKPGPDEARTLGAVQDLVKLGRKHGIGPVLFTQRGAGLNKEVSELCDLLVAFRTPGPIDQERVKDWLDANKTRGERDQIMGQLSGLPTGTAVFASSHPDLKVFGVYPVRMPETFDSSATPKVGQRRVEPKTLAAPDLEDLRRKMADAIERAKADDPKALRTEIAALRKQLGNGQVKAAIVYTEKPVFDEAAFAATFERIATLSDGAAKAAAEAKAEIGKTLVEYRNTQRAAVKAKPQPKTVASTPSMEPPLPVAAAGSGPGDPSIGQSGLRRIMIALAQRPLGLTNRQIGLRAGVSSKSGTFSTYMSKARTSGWVEGRPLARLTHDGIAALGEFTPLPTGSDLLAYWLAALGESGAARLLRAFANAYPNSLSNAEAGEAAEISSKSGTFSTYMSKLRTLELIEPGVGGNRASSELFE